jgi:hypothetical protein
MSRALRPVNAEARRPDVIDRILYDRDLMPSSHSFYYHAACPDIEPIGAAVSKQTIAANGALSHRHQTAFFGHGRLSGWRRPIPPPVCIIRRRIGRKSAEQTMPAGQQLAALRPLCAV